MTLGSRRRRRGGSGTPASARRWLAWAAGLAVLVAFLHWSARIVVFRHNGRLASAQFRFEEEDFRHPRLAELRRRERLDEVVAGARTELGRVVALREWTHRQWVAGERFRYPPFDALEILDLARNHGNRAFCAQYAVVLLQACQSLGIHARYVNLPAHFVVSVWSDDFDRWMVMDPQRDVHFEREGVPLGARALSDAYRRKSFGGIEVCGPGKTRHPAAAADLEPYRAVAIVMDADQLRNPVRYSRDGTVRVLARESDWRDYPEVGRDTLVFWNRQLVWKQPGGPPPDLGGTASSDREDFDYPMNQTVIVTQRSRSRQDVINVGLLAEETRDAGAFLVRVDDGGWEPSPARFRWTLRPGRNRLACRVRTSFGWLGPESRVVAWYWPSLW